MDWDVRSTVLITCAPGLVAHLQREVESLDFAVRSTHRSGLTVRGSLTDTIRLNLHLRTAFNVLYLLKEFRCKTADRLYNRVAEVAWEEIIDPDGYLSVASHVDTPTIRNSMYSSLKVKDAVVDRMVERCGKRPDAGPDRKGVVLTLYWKDDLVRLYLNTSGRKLADRGYRKIPFKAPMQETLAAGVVMETGYDGSQPFVNPMCGSGTLAIEAALIATRRGPGLLRSGLALTHIGGFDSSTWKMARAKAKKAQGIWGAEHPPIIVSDIDPAAIDATRRNARTAGVEQLLTYHVCDFAETPLPDEPTIVVMNPEYGMRMGDVERLEATYARIGDFFKQRCAGSTGWVFTGNMDLAKKVGLRASRRVPFFNAEIDCRLLKYEMYEGTRKVKA